MKRVIDHSGERFGKLVALERLPGPGRARYLCRCDCGNLKEVTGDHLVSGNTTSCGCVIGRPKKGATPDYAKAECEYGVKRMVDLKKLFPAEADEWWKSPCETCTLERKKKGRCATANCVRFNNWFAKAWKRARKEVLARASREGVE